MTLFAKLKAVAIPPKTEDPQYDEARAALCRCQIDRSAFSDSIRRLTTSLSDLASACRRCSHDVRDWVGDDAPPEWLAQARRAAAFGSRIEGLTRDLTARVQPNFLHPLADYEREVAELVRLKAARESARKDFDRNREYLRHIETAKRPDRADIDRAIAKADDSQETYENANAQFIGALALFVDQRRHTLGLAFRHIAALLVKYIRAVAPTGTIESYDPIIAFEETAWPASPHDSLGDDESFISIRPFAALDLGSIDKRAPGRAETADYSNPFDSSPH